MRHPTDNRNAAGVDIQVIAPSREFANRRFHRVKRQRNVLLVVDALGAATGFARGLDGGKEQTGQHPDDRDNDQQLNERKTGFERLFHLLFLYRIRASKTR